MRYNSVVGHPKSIGILRVDGLSMGPPNLRRHNRSTIVRKGSDSSFHDNIILQRCNTK